MTAKMESCKRTKMEWVLPLFKGYIYSTAVMLGSIGVILVLITWHCKRHEIQPWLNAPDPLLGFSNRTVLLLAGTLHLAFSGWLFATRDSINRVIIALWVALNYFLYRVAMFWIVGMKAPFAMEEFSGWRLGGVRPETVDLCWKLFIAYLVVGSSVFVLLKLWQLKQLKNEAWVRQWLKMREQGCSPKTPVIQKSTGTANDYLKTSCPYCGGYVEFPLMGSGRKSPARIVRP